MGRSKSLGAVWRDAIRDSDLAPTPKLVAYTLSTYMSADGAAYPSRALLAKGASLGSGLRSVDGAIRELELTGFLDNSSDRAAERVTVTKRALPESAQALRRSEWKTAQAVRGLTDRQQRTKRLATAQGSTANGARSAPESFESDQSEVGRPLRGGGRRLLPVDECMRCFRAPTPLRLPRTTPLQAVHHAIDRDAGV